MTLFGVEPQQALIRERAEVLAIGAWANNAELIRDVAELGYLDGSVFDATYGEGNFWALHRPDNLTTNDLHKPADHALDYRALPAGLCFDTVVFDPPYRLSGRRDRGEFDQRFGLAEYRSNDDILDDIAGGTRSCWGAARRFLLVKCQDQVNGGRVRWQTDLVTRAVEELGGRKVDRFDFVTPSRRPQPAHRQQLTARRNHSTLLVFKRGAAS